MMVAVSLPAAAPRRGLGRFGRPAGIALLILLLGFLTLYPMAVLFYGSLHSTPPGISGTFNLDGYASLALVAADGFEGKAAELAPEKIRVNAIAPAVIETPVYDTFLTPEQVKAVLPSFNTFHPLGRNGQVADVAEALLFLASDQASFITGVVLPVDGGVMAGRQ